MHRTRGVLGLVALIVALLMCSAGPASAQDETTTSTTATTVAEDMTDDTSDDLDEPGDVDETDDDDELDDSGGELTPVDIEMINGINALAAQTSNEVDDLEKVAYGGVAIGIVALLAAIAAFMAARSDSEE